ncbi:Lysine-specific demethylase 2B [Orchesella cincta]|uniref:Lysine-specific demethylase 2B n=1 Tax=Orchesella cincta TaxID=48709 RepID=A0A1D2MV94_ORCCI|nr:Lysine-specific demethylase 2B [Orchesella cincta]
MQSKDEVDPTDILPEEVWLVIFGHLKDTQDLLNCMRTCNTWNGWLDRKKFLFPEVLGILSREMSMPKNEFLKLRKVCKKRKDDVDTHYEQEPRHLGCENQTQARKLQWRNNGNDGICFSSSTQIQHFLNVMNKHYENPFVGRSIFIKYDYGNDQEFSIILMKLLAQFGKHIWYFYIMYEFQGIVTIAPLVEETVRDCLLFLPNVKKLYLDANVPGCMLMINAVVVIERMKTFLGLNLWPANENLVSLSFGGSYGVPSPLTWTIILKNRDTLKNIDFGMHKYHKYGSKLQNLEEVHQMINEMEDFKQLKYLPTTLKKLVLYKYLAAAREDREHFDRRHFSFDLVFKALERFGKTLNEVYIDLKLSTGFFRSFKTFKPNLPALEKLSICLNGPLDPLLHFKSLKHLEILFYVSRSWAYSRIKVSGLENRMYESNIWELMPALETLIIKGTEENPFTVTYIRKYRSSSLKAAELRKEAAEYFPELPIVPAPIPINIPEADGRQVIDSFKNKVAGFFRYIYIRAWRFTHY